jgi:ABC-type multidrug transport system fused ATPase/permease subunit
MEGEVTAVKIFTALSLFKMLQQPLRNLPQVISQFYQALSSLQRIQKFYVMKDKEEIEKSELINNLNRKLGSVEINDINFRWNDNDVCNNSIDGEDYDYDNNSNDHGIDKDDEAFDSISNQFKNIFKLNNSKAKQSYEKLSDQMELSVSNPLNNISPKRLRKSNNIHEIKSKSFAKKSLILSKLFINKSISTLCCGGLEDLNEDEEDGMINNNNNNENINFRLKIKNLNIMPSKLVVVKGLVGVGKTAFIMSLLREMYINNSSDNKSTKTYSQKHFQPCKGSISFVSQQVKSNISFLNMNLLFILPLKIYCNTGLDSKYDFKRKYYFRITLYCKKIH